MAILIQMTGSLAVVAILASVFGLIRTKMRDDLAQVVLGVCFGLVTLFQMNSPLALEPGLIVDMRNVPVALAGAFLGWRGAVSCLAIAIGTRLGIGGVGMPAGVVGMCIACCAGALWNHFTYRLSARSWPHFALLAAMMSLHLGAALMMPWPALMAFVREGAPYVLSLNFIAVPMVAALLEVERVRKSREALALSDLPRSEDTLDPKTGLMRFDLFARDLCTLSRNERERAPAGLLVVRFDDLDHVERAYGADGLEQVLLATRLRVQSLIRTETPMGLTDDLRMVIPLDFHQIADRDQLETRLRRMISDQSVSLPGDRVYRLKVTVTTRYTPNVNRLETCLDAIAEDARDATGLASRLRAMVSAKSPSRNQYAPARSESSGRFDNTFRQDVLFRKADVLLAARHG